MDSVDQSGRSVELPLDPENRNPFTKNKPTAREQTRIHILMVRAYIEQIRESLNLRGRSHDATKLESPEVEVFDEYTEKLAGVTYGSREYKAFLKEMKPALAHHYLINRHHPEHYDRGVSGMNLIDIVEMFCDWMAAAKRHDDGDIRRSIEVNRVRFSISAQLIDVFNNTVKALECEQPAAGRVFNGDYDQALKEWFKDDIEKGRMFRAKEEQPPTPLGDTLIPMDKPDRPGVYWAWHKHHKEWWLLCVRGEAPFLELGIMRWDFGGMGITMEFCTPIHGFSNWYYIPKPEAPCGQKTGGNDE